jgi:hypothetical protein
LAPMPQEVRSRIAAKAGEDRFFIAPPLPDISAPVIYGHGSLYGSYR